MILYPLYTFTLSDNFHFFSVELHVDNEQQVVEQFPHKTVQIDPDIGGGGKLYIGVVPPWVTVGNKAVSTLGLKGCLKELIINHK